MFLLCPAVLQRLFPSATVLGEDRSDRGSFLHLSVGFRCWVLLALPRGHCWDQNLFQAKTYAKQFSASNLCSGSLCLHSPLSSGCGYKDGKLSEKDTIYHEKKKKKSLKARILVERSDSPRPAMKKSRQGPRELQDSFQTEFYRPSPTHRLTARQTRVPIFRTRATERVEHFSGQRS